MAERRPLVLADGRIRGLPAGDTLPAYSGQRVIAAGITADAPTIADAGGLLRCQNTGALTITLNVGTLTARMTGDVLREAAGSVTFVAGAGVTLLPAVPGAIREVGSGASWVYLGSNIFWIIGDLASGAAGGSDNNVEIRTVTGTADTPVAADAGKQLDCTNAGATVITLNPGTFASGDWFNVLMAAGTGVTFALAGGATILGTDTPALSRIGAACSVLYRGSNSFSVVGEVAPVAGGQPWTVVATGSTLADQAPKLAVVTTQQDFALPATITAGQRFTVLNSITSTPGVGIRVLAGAGRTLQGLAVGDNFVAYPGELVDLVATSATHLNLLTAIVNSVWGQVTGTLANQTDLQSALNAKLGITAKANDSEQLDGVDGARFVFGNNSTKTTSLGVADMNTPQPSGFFEYQSGSTNTPNGNWCWVMNHRHTNETAPSGHYGFQFANGIGTNNFFLRGVDAGTWFPWLPIATAGGTAMATANPAYTGSLTNTGYGSAVLTTGNAKGRIGHNYFGITDYFTFSANYSRTGEATGVLDNGLLSTAEVQVLGRNGVAGQVRLMAGGVNQAPAEVLLAQPGGIVVQDSAVVTSTSTNSTFLALRNTAASGRGYSLFSSGGGPAAAGTFGVYDETGAVTRLLMLTNGTIAPGGDNTQPLGDPILRFTEVRAVNGTINTSDARDKVGARTLTPQELAAAKELAGAFRMYQWRDSVAIKGAANARWHFSPEAQTVVAIMQSHGLDPFRYGFVCYDEWSEALEVVETWPARPAVRDTEDNITEPAVAAGRRVLRPARAAGNRYGLRPDQLSNFVMAGLHARLAALEVVI